MKGYCPGQYVGCCDRTYEGLKLELVISFDIFFVVVAIVPMRV